MQSCVWKLSLPRQVAQDSGPWMLPHSLHLPGRATRGDQPPPPRAGSPQMIRPHLQWGWGRSCLQAPPRSWPKGLTPPGSSKPRSGHRTSPPQGQKGPLIPLFHRARRARNLRARGRWLFISGRHPPAKWVVAGIWHHISRSNSRVL